MSGERRQPAFGPRDIYGGIGLANGLPGEEAIGGCGLIGGGYRTTGEEDDADGYQDQVKNSAYGHVHLLDANMDIQ